MNREFDVIVFGATGFTGQLACEYLENTLQRAKENERIKKDRRTYQNEREFYQYVFIQCNLLQCAYITNIQRKALVLDIPKK